MATYMYMILPIFGSFHILSFNLNSLLNLEDSPIFSPRWSN